MTVLTSCLPVSAEEPPSFSGCIASFRSVGKKIDYSTFKTKLAKLREFYSSQSLSQEYQNAEGNLYESFFAGSGIKTDLGSLKMDHAERESILSLFVEAAEGNGTSAKLVQEIAKMSEPEQAEFFHELLDFPQVRKYIPDRNELELSKSYSTDSVISNLKSDIQESGASAQASLRKFHDDYHAKHQIASSLELISPGIRKAIHQQKAIAKKLTENGALPLNEAGAPDAELYHHLVAAKTMRERNPDLLGFNPTEKATIQKLIVAYEATQDALFSGHNALLKTLQFEHQPIVSLIRPNRMAKKVKIDEPYAWIYDSESWTRNSALSGRITGANSKSPLNSYGKDAEREIFWPMKDTTSRKNPYGKKAKSDSEIEMSRIRLAINRAPEGIRLVDRSMEIFVKDESGSWQPFVLENISGEWVPMKRFLKHPIEGEKGICMGCHKAGNGQLSPKPFFLNTPADFEHVGYGSQKRLIEKLIGFN